VCKSWVGRDGECESGGCVSEKEEDKVTHFSVGLMFGLFL